MKVSFIARGRDYSSTRYRVWQYLDYLKKNQVEVEFKEAPGARSILKWLALVNQVREADIVFIQRKRISNFWLRRLKKKGARIIYDFDDALMFASSRHKSQDSPRRMKRFIRMVKGCDCIIVGNSYLKSLTEPHHPHIWILPTSIDLTKYKVKDYNNPMKERITLGWIGGGKSLFFLKQLKPVLERIGKQYNNVELKIVCSDFFDSESIPVVKKIWREEEESQDILDFDIGLAPLPDDPWGRGKSATKLLQYMASGVPAVAAPVGVHNEIIKQGVNGWRARTPDEWFDKISRLIETPTLRRDIGLASRKTVEVNYSLQVNAPKLLDILTHQISNPDISAVSQTKLE